MKSVITFIIIAMLISPINTWAQQHIGLLKTVSGDVKIQRDESSLVGNSGLKLINTDIVTTGDKGYAGIIFTDGTTVTIGSGTEFNIKSYKFKPATKEYDFSAYLKKGSIIYNSGKIGKLSPDSVNLSTPRASIGIRGTRFIIKVQ